MNQPGPQRRRVVMYGNPILRTCAQPVAKLTDDVRALLADLKNTMLVEDGLGLAANQIAVPLQVFAVNPRAVDIDAEPYCVLNPQVITTEGRIEREEGCLSLPELYDVVPRPEMIVVAGLDESGRPKRLEVSGKLARAFAHEIDHLNAKMFIDLLGPVRRRFVEARLMEIAAAEARLSAAERERRSCG